MRRQQLQAQTVVLEVVKAIATHGQTYEEGVVRRYDQVSRIFSADLDSDLDEYPREELGPFDHLGSLAFSAFEVMAVFRRYAPRICSVFGVGDDEWNRPLLQNLDAHCGLALEPHAANQALEIGVKAWSHYYRTTNDAERVSIAKDALKWMFPEARWDELSPIGDTVAYVTVGNGIVASSDATREVLNSSLGWD